MATIRIQVRRGLASQWTSVNPTLEAGEIGLETDTNKIKFGTGSTAWTALSYLSVGDIPEIAMDAINTALSLGSGLTKSYNDATDTISISLDTAVVATLSGTQTLTNKTLTSPVINTPTGITKSDVGLANVDNTTDANKPVSTAAQTALDLKAPIASPTFTGTVAGVTKAHVGLGNVDNTSDASKPISTATQTALDAKATNASLASHEADTTDIHGITNTALLATMDYVDDAVGALSSSVDTDFIPVTDRGTMNGVAPLNSSVKIENSYLTSDVVLKDETQTLTNKSLTSPSLTGVPIAPTAAAGTNTTQVATTAYTVAAINALIDGAPGTLNTLNELAAAVNDDASYAAAIASELTAKAPLASPSFSGTVSLPPTTSIGSVNGTNISYLEGVTSAIQTQINAKAPLDSPTFTGTVVGIGKSMVGLGNVDNTADSAKPVSTATQTALDLKAALAAPTFTGAVVLPATTLLGSDNLQSALNLKAPLASPTFTGAVVLPDSTVSTAMIADSAITSGKIADGTIVNADINGAAAISTSKIDGLDNTLSSKAPTASPTFTGTVVLPATTSIGDVSAEELQSISTVVSNVQTQISSKADALNASIAGATFTGTVVLPSTTSIADVSATEISYLNNVTGNIQTQLNNLGTADSTHAALTLNVHGIANTALLATTADVAAVTKTTLGLGNVDNTADTAKPVSTSQASAIATAKAEAIADATSQVNALLTGAPAALNTLDELAAALGDDSNFAASVTTNLGLKVDSLTPISQKTASYTLSSLTERDDLIEMSSASALTLTIPTDATLDFPIGTSIDILQTGAGQVTIAPVSGTVTVNATPGLKLRTTWSSATLFKRAANTWVVFGDLTA